MSKIGIFGGSFNPVHNGHIHLAESVMKKLNLDKIIIMPANIPPHKQCHDYADCKDRLEMCRLACEDYDGFEVSNWEISRNTISYTINTVMHFKQEYPQNTFYLMVGSDMLMSFDKWYRYKEILKCVILTVVSREKNDIEVLMKKKSYLEQFGRVLIVDTEPLVISSTDIRKIIKNHGFYSCYLNEKVVQYIKQKKLYGI